MRFLQPIALLLIPAALAVAAAVLAWSRKRRTAARREFAGRADRAWSDPGFVRWRARTDLALAAGAIVFLGIALARPARFEPARATELRGVPYLIALDTSRSMLTPDVRPSRWHVATNALSRFLNDARGDRVGLITFSGVPYLNAPLTFDMRALQTMLRYTSPITFDPDGQTAGSDLGAAVERAGRYFVSNQISPRVVILVSDGEDLSTSFLVTARRWTTQGVRVCTIGVGTRAGAKVPRINWGGVAQNSSGQDVVSRLNEANLKRLAAASGGRYYPLGPNGEGFDLLRREFLDPLSETTARQDLQNYSERYQFPLLAGIVCLVGRFLIAASRIRQPVKPVPVHPGATRSITRP
jgi:Ca-activated chloride channel homolog